MRESMLPCKDKDNKNQILLIHCFLFLLDLTGNNHIHKITSKFYLIGGFL